MPSADDVRQDPDWVKGAARAHVYLRVLGMDDVEVLRDSTYKTTDRGPLHFDFYRPLAPAAGAAPCVIFIHGGPIPSNLLTNPKDWGVFQSFGRLLGAAGLAAVAFNHRFFSPAEAKDALADVQDLVEHVRERSESLGIDRNRVCLWAFSGGGVLLSPFLGATPDYVRCIVAYYAVMHASAPEFSPATQIAANAGRLPDILVARAGHDVPALNDALAHFIDQALKKNATLDLLNHATGQHGFDCRDDNERTRDILRRTIEFVKASLA